MKISLKLIFIVVLFCLLCACAEQREIEELGFVVSLQPIIYINWL